MIKVAKFGGSSLSDGAQFAKVKNIIEQDPSRRVVVVSAPGRRTSDDNKVTDLLYLVKAHIKYDVSYDSIFEMIEQRYMDIRSECDLSLDLDQEFEIIRSKLSKNISMDYLASRGEFLNAKLMAEYLGYQFLDSADLISFKYNGDVDMEKTEQNFKEIFDVYNKIVIPGFYGSLPNGDIKVFSRGGSDVSGAIAAASLDADVYENWTDVSGMLLADPQIVDNPLPVPLITYKELRELSAMGAQVMHEDVVFPVRKMGIPINIRNTNCPKAPGTLIANIGDERESLLKISGISGGKGYAGFLIEKDRLSEDLELRSKVMDVFSKEGIAINNVVSGIDSLNIFTREENVKGKISRLEIEIKSIIGSGSVTANTGISLIAVVSRHMVKSLALGAKVLTALASRNINVKMIDYGVDGVNTLIGVANSNYEKAVKAIYREFIKK